jgi:uncharacterized membrane protein YebE (DUF533 family)
MFDPEQLLGQLMTGGLNQRASVNKNSIGIGLLGVAIAAYEHYSKSNEQPSQPLTHIPPPPPPEHKVAVVPPPPPGPAAKAAKTNEELDLNPAVALIRAMVAAANADGTIDSQERRFIAEQVSQLGAEAEAFIETEITRPRTLEDILTDAKRNNNAEEVYTVSLLAIRVDTEVERNYLARLAQGLGLSAEQIKTIEKQIGV